MPPSEVPEPASQGQATESPTSPITIGSAEEEQVGSQNDATESPEEATPAATIASTGEGEEAQKVRAEGTLRVQSPTRQQGPLNPESRPKGCKQRKQRKLRAEEV